MAVMYANKATSGMEEVEKLSEFNLNAKGLAFPEDERSTDASGSEPVTSGSEDESTTPQQSPELKYAQPKMIVADNKASFDLAWLWAALRCERRAPVNAPRSACATAPKARGHAFTQVTRCNSGAQNQTWKVQRPQKKPSPSDASQRMVNAPHKPAPTTKQPAPVEKQRQVLAQLLQNQQSTPPGLEPVAPNSAFRPPPGLENEIGAPPGLSAETKPPAHTQLEKPAPQTQPHYFPTTAFEVVPYSRKTFRKEMTSIFNDIRQARTASLQSAVHRVRAQNVPKEDQASIYSELMTRAVEEMSGPGRRLCMAFVTGIAAGSPSAFDKTECIAGIKIFFDDVYESLKEEVPKLSTRVEREFIPALRPIFDARELNEALPARLRVAP